MWPKVVHQLTLCPRSEATNKSAVFIIISLTTLKGKAKYYLHLYMGVWGHFGYGWEWGVKVLIWQKC